MSPESKLRWQTPGMWRRILCMIGWTLVTLIGIPMVYMFVSMDMFLLGRRQPDVTQAAWWMNLSFLLGQVMAIVVLLLGFFGWLPGTKMTGTLVLPLRKIIFTILWIIVAFLGIPMAGGFVIALATGLTALASHQQLDVSQMSRWMLLSSVGGQAGAIIALMLGYRGWLPGTRVKPLRD